MELKKKMQMVSRKHGVNMKLSKRVFNGILVCLPHFLWFSLCQARDEEKNRRNNTDSTNQVMKDLEDLLPNQALSPPAVTPEPGQYAVGQKQCLAIYLT